MCLYVYVCWWVGKKHALPCAEEPSKKHIGGGRTHAAERPLRCRCPNDAVIVHSPKGTSKAANPHEWFHVTIEQKWVLLTRVKSGGWCVLARAWQADVGLGSKL